MAVFDTHSLMRILKKEPGYEFDKSELSKGGIVNQSTLYEFYYVVLRDLISKGYTLDEAIPKSLSFFGSIKKYLSEQHLTDEIIIESARMKIFYKNLDLSHFDCIALATAKSLNQKLCTGDKSMKKVHEVEFV